MVVQEQKEALGSTAWKNALNELMVIEENTTLNLGERLGQIIEILNTIFPSSGNTGKLFKLDMTETGAHYIIHELLRQVIVENYAEIGRAHV